MTVRWTIVAQGDRMARIVQSLLLFSRQRKPECGAVGVREAMEQTIAGPGGPVFSS